MQDRTVITLEEASRDLDAGKAFYDEKEDGVGLYFIDSLLSDIESLKIFAGIHSQRFGFYRSLSKRFPFAIYYDIYDFLNEQTKRAPDSPDHSSPPKQLDLL